MKVSFLGDIHEEYWILDLVPARTELIIQVGDFGFIHLKPVDMIPIIETWFIDGNHDSIDLLSYFASQSKDDKVLIAQNVHYIPRGTVLEIGNSLVGFLGGAESVDADTRTEGIDWFRDEGIKMRDVMKLNDNLKGRRLDYLVCHATPAKSVIRFMSDTHPQASSILLHQAITEWRPRNVVCGHIHMERTDTVSYPDTVVHILDINQFVTFEL